MSDTVSILFVSEFCKTEDTKAEDGSVVVWLILVLKLKKLIK
jgi:hypothetical protein